MFGREKRELPVPKPGEVLYEIDNGHVNELQSLIKRGANINEKNRFGMTPLMIAAEAETPIFAEIVKILIEAGANLTEKDYFGKTAVDYALFRRSQAKALLIQQAIAAQKKAAEEDRPADYWRKMDASRVSRITVFAEEQRKLTDIFNFKTRERIVLSTNLETSAEGISPPVLFDAVAPQILEEALRNFTDMGGVADRDFVLRGVVRMEKSAAPGK